MDPTPVERAALQPTPRSPPDHQQGYALGLLWRLKALSPRELDTVRVTEHLTLESLSDKPPRPLHVLTRLSRALAHAERPARLKGSRQ